MKKEIFIYGFILAAAAFILEWAEYRYFARAFSAEIYIVLVAVLFTALGIWVGNQLTRKTGPEAFEKNVAAVKSLGISAREYEVLELLAAGHSNKEIARDLGISPNTVKTHAAKLYEKLNATKRLQAVQIARELSLIP